MSADTVLRDEPKRALLEGVPYVGTDLHTLGTDDGARRLPEGPYMSCLRACLE